MLTDYWWVFVGIIILLMIFYPTNKKEKFKNNNIKSLIHNLPTITSYYIGIN